MTVDLDSLQWWGSLFHKWITSLGVIGLGFYHWIEWLQKAEENIKWVDHHIERRKGDGMTLSDILKDVEKAKQLAPQLEAVFSAAKALGSAIEALEVAFKANQTSSGGPPIGQV